METEARTPETTPASSPPASPPLPETQQRAGLPNEPAIKNSISLEASDDSFNDPSVAHLPELKVSDLHFRPQRHIMLPVVLFLATCASTFWVGVTRWEPVEDRYIANYAAMGRVIQANWANGVEYMVAVLAILLTHEMGHFLQTVKNRIPASYPLCIPVPFNAIGTMGAVIGMDGTRANRRQIFDIGIAGPLAGLVVAVPVLWYGIKSLDLTRFPQNGEFQLYMPPIGQWMLGKAHPEWARRSWIGITQLNPLFMAGWVGMLITGLNMMPISQLDGGHTIYALFLEKAHTIAKWFVSLAIFYVVVNLNDAVMWVPMLVLVIFMGIHHPPTADDNVKLGPIRWAIGLASLTIPFLCFPIQGFRAG
jgi:membrane-associated protease RseP (regulator of RpoE activity)